MRMRLDVALERAGLARSRTHAQRIIREGRARIDGRLAKKPSAPVARLEDLTVVDVPDGIEYASRAAHKLRGALEELHVDVAGLRCLDAGASTGGFTDILLRRGAAHVIAVDIGHQQLDPRLAADERVEVRDGTSLRGLRPEHVGGPADLLVSDLSFISLTTVMSDLASLVAVGGDALLMVKPQFEVGRRRLPRGGVVTDPVAHRDAVVAVARSAAEQGLELIGAGASPLAGQDGNREFFLHLRRTSTAVAVPKHHCAMIDEAVHGARWHAEGGEQR